jgi:SAM-dependent methyltransferase
MNDKTREYFDDNAKSWISESYNKKATIAHVRLDAVQDLVRLHAPNSLLDVGCGDGRFLQTVDDVEVRAGIDYSEQMIELASASNPDISFTQVDLNDKQGLEKLHHVGQYDFVTMMGVVHYLESPVSALQGIEECCNENARFVISFRNRLLNANPSSKYYESPVNMENLTRLGDESELWTRIELENNDLLSKADLDPEGHRLIELIQLKGEFEGVTDNYWNPDGLNHWRQFTPLDAVILLNKAGFTTLRIVPLVTSSNDDEKMLKPANGGILTECSSFILLGKPSR